MDIILATCSQRIPQGLISGNMLPHNVMSNKDNNIEIEGTVQGHNIT